MKTLNDYARLGYAEVSATTENEASFRLYWLAYSDRRDEAVCESNMAVMHERIKAVDAEHVRDDGHEVYVTMFDAAGKATPAYKALLEVHEELENYGMLDDDDVGERMQAMAHDDAIYHRDEAEAIIDGGKAAFEADETCTTYCGDWGDFEDYARDEAIAELAYRMAYAAIDEGY